MASSSDNKNNNSEPAKTEQIITEFFAKSLHIILESRSPCVSSRHYSGEQIPSSPSSSSSSSSSVRPLRDKWFNLALRECPAALENLDLWRQSNLEPMVVDVVLVEKQVDFDHVCYSPAKEQFPSSWNPRHEGLVTDMKSEKIIERWIVQYESRSTSKDFGKVSKRGGGNSSSLYKKSIILLRSLYLTVRILPAYNLYRDLNSSAQIDTFSLAHRVSSFVEPFTRREEAEMHRFAFTPVETSCGRLCLSVLYRPTLSDVNSETSTPMSPRFIPDYVGSPTTNPLKRFPSLPRSELSQGSPSSVPFERRHSWSNDASRNFAPSMSSSPSHMFSDSLAISSKLYSQPVSNPRQLPEYQYSYNASLAHKNTSFDESWPSPMFSPSPSPSPPTHFSGNQLSKALLRSDSAPVSIPTARLKYPVFPSYNVPQLSPTRKTKLSASSLTDNAKALMKLRDIPTGITTQKLSSAGKDELGNISGAKSSLNTSSKVPSSRSFGRFSFQDEIDDSEFCPFAFDDIDTVDPRVRAEFYDRKGHLSEPIDPGGFLPIRKSQDAAVGSLVSMLKTARPLRQDFSNSKMLQACRPEFMGNCVQELGENSNSEARVINNPACSSGNTSSGLLMLKTTSEALEELQSYKNIKEKLLKQGSEYQTSNAPPHASAETTDKDGM